MAQYDDCCWMLKCQLCKLPLFINNMNKYQCQSITCIGCRKKICRKCGEGFENGYRGLRHKIKDVKNKKWIKCHFKGYNDINKFKRQRKKYFAKNSVSIYLYIFYFNDNTVCKFFISINRKVKRQKLL